MKVMFLPEKYGAQFMQYRQSVNPALRDKESLEQDMLQVLYSTILHHFPDSKLTSRNPDLMVIFSGPMVKYEDTIHRYPHIRKIFFYDENIDARGNYIDRFRYANLKITNRLKLNKNISRKLDIYGDKLIPILTRRERNKYRYPLLRKYLENASQNDSFIITNNYQGDHIFNYPYFMRYFCLIRRLSGSMQRETHEHRGKFCAFIGRNYTAERKVFIENLMGYKKVDHMGKENHATMKIADTERFGVILNSNLSELPKIYKYYKFVLCFENSIADDYITEKIVLAMCGGAIPLYYGTPDIQKYFNPSRFIHYDNYDSFASMRDAVIELDQDPQQYQAMLAQPFFPDNRLPDAILNRERNFQKFLHRALAG